MPTCCMEQFQTKVLLSLELVIFGAGMRTCAIAMVVNAGSGMWSGIGRPTSSYLFIATCGSGNAGDLHAL